jgi:phospholipase D3/4
MLNGALSRMYISASPQGLCPSGRSDDLEAIRAVIAGAREYIYVSVMDYAPAFLYTKEKLLWPVLADDFKRAAHDHGVHVRFLASNWTHTVPGMVGWLGSLQSFCTYGGCDTGTIDVRWYTVPTGPPPVVPFTRVQHDKYLLTDRGDVYITTSNMTPDYFFTTAGVSLNVNQKHLRDQLRDVHVRDWNSIYTKSQNEFVVNNPVNGHRGGPSYPPRIPIGRRHHRGHNTTKQTSTLGSDDDADDHPMIRRRRRQRVYH